MRDWSRVGIAVELLEFLETSCTVFGLEPDLRPVLVLGQGSGYNVDHVLGGVGRFGEWAIVLGEVGW
jgi:hypothetical protein